MNVLRFGPAIRQLAARGMNRDLGVARPPNVSRYMTNRVQPRATDVGPLTDSTALGVLDGQAQWQKGAGV